MSTSTSPSAPDPRAYRQVAGLFATGVTVVATELNGKIHGMTANAIASVSLEPLLILVCVQKDAHMAEILQQAGQFSINILSAEQQPLSNYFAGMWPADTPAPDFSFAPWDAGPRLKGAIGALACRINEILEGGDHWIILGAVVALHQQSSPADPLLYYSGGYRRLAAE